VFLALRKDVSDLERSVLAEIRALDARDAVMGLVERLSVSALKLELAHSRRSSLAASAQLHALALDAATKLVRDAHAEVVDIMCEITKHASLRRDFARARSPTRRTTTHQGLRLIACLAPRIRRSRRASPASMTTPDVPRRQWAAHARPPAAARRGPARAARALPAILAGGRHALSWRCNPKVAVAQRPPRDRDHERESQARHVRAVDVAVIGTRRRRSVEAGGGE
jgi:hypothetical protein